MRSSFRYSDIFALPAKLKVDLFKKSSCKLCLWLQLSNNNNKTNNPVNNHAKDRITAFFTEDVQLAPKHMKRSSISLVTRETQIKTAV